MLYCRNTPKKERLVRATVDLRTSEKLADLCRFYRLPTSEVLSALIAQEHTDVWELTESVKAMLANEQGS